jgi:para-nitrobenzyl esterase
LFIGDDIAIAETVYGKVRGFILRGIYQFRAIPYGADTSGKNRFMLPGLDGSRHFWMAE